jgi:DNA-binding CsgD family transcriptional regulator
VAFQERRRISRDLHDSAVQPYIGLELRQYDVNLKKAEAHRQLVTAVRTQAKKFAEFHRIDAQVIAQTDIPLQNEVMHIAREGLSNIRRHTCAERATINLREAQGHLFLELISDKAPQAAKRKFCPRQLASAPPSWAAGMDESPAHSTLTAAERKVVAAVMRHKDSPNKVVAAFRHLSEHTLLNHLASIYGKLGIHRRVNLVLYGIEHKLGTLPS